MSDNKFKTGMSVREIEAFAKKNRFEVFLCVVFFLACVFSFIMWGTGWAIIAAFLGAVGGTLMTERVDLLSKKTLAFVFKQEATTQMVLAIVMLILAIVLPPLYFLLLGLHGGKSLHHQIVEMHNHSQH